MNYQDPNQQGQYPGYSGGQQQPPYAQQQPPYGQQPGDPYSQQQPPYGQQPGDPYSQQQAPYGQQQPPYGQQQAPYGQSVYGTGKSDDTSMGMKQHHAVALSYAFGWITGLIVFLVEKKNQLVRFHAMQSILLFGGVVVLDIVLSFIPFVNLLVYPLNLAAFIVWLILLINAFQGRYFKLPVIGDYAERFTNRPSM